MARCLTLAASCRTSPNPMVGAVIVRGGKIIAEGAHCCAGKPHAEIIAFQKLNFNAKGATLYCNLEPCFHHGRTPPCVHEVIRSGIKRVVIAQRDPNPLVNGRSLKLLRRSGIEVQVGVLEEEAQWLNRFFITWITQKRPHLVLKLGVSLDGKITPTGKKTGFLTGPAARKRVHEIRSEVDAILVGSRTVLVDNPKLTVRGIRGASQPARIVLDSKLKTPLRSNLFKTKGGPVILATTVSDPKKIVRYTKAGAQVWVFKKNAKGQVPLGPLCRRMAEEELLSVLVEGGAQVFSSFVNEKLADEIVLFVAPKICGPQAVDAFAKVHSRVLYQSKSQEKRGRDLEVLLLPAGASSATPKNLKKI